MHTMSSDMQYKLGSYSTMQRRYADPRAQLAQENEERRIRAASMHQKVQKTSALLEDAYTRQVKRNRTDHEKRLNILRDRKSSTRPSARVKVAHPRQTAD